MAANKTKSATISKRLYRSRNDKVIAGVCGGIGEYLDTDPVWIRLAAVLLAFCSGLGIIMYIVAWILVPENPFQHQSARTAAEKAVKDLKVEKDMDAIRNRRASLKILIGVFLLLIGLALLFKLVFSWFNFNMVWPILLILLGVYILRRKN